MSAMASFTPQFLAGNPLLPTPSLPTHCGSERFAVSGGHLRREPEGRRVWMSHLSECNKSHLERICQLPPQTYRSSSAHTMRSDTQDAAIPTSRGSVPRCTQSRKQMHQPCPPAPEQHWGHTWHLRWSGLHVLPLFLPRLKHHLLHSVNSHPRSSPMFFTPRPAVSNRNTM